MNSDLRFVWPIALLASAGLFSCASKPADRHSALTITVQKQPAACREAYGYACIETRIANSTAHAVAFGLSEIDGLLVADANASGIDIRRAGSDWESAIEELGTFEAPSRFLHVAAESSASLIVLIPVPAELESVVDSRVTLRDSTGAANRTKFEYGQ